jgi:hypothetical protein
VGVVTPEEAHDEIRRQIEFIHGDREWPTGEVQAHSVEDRRKQFAELLPPGTFVFWAVPLTRWQRVRKRCARLVRTWRQ